MMEALLKAASAGELEWAIRGGAVLLGTLAALFVSGWAGRRLLLRELPPAARVVLDVALPGLRAAVAVEGLLLALRAFGIGIPPWIFRSVGVALATYVALRAVHGLMPALRVRLRRADDFSADEQRRLDTLLRTLERIAEVAIGLVGLLIILQQMAIDITPVLTAAGIGGIALGFGAQTLVRDLITGGFILFEDQMRVGDVVEINGKSGVVEQINLRTTVLRDLDGTVHTIPNGEIKMVSNMTKNWSRCVVDIGVAYKEDVDRVMDLLRRVGEELAADPRYQPMILQPLEVLGVNDFGGSGVVIRAMWTTEPLRQWEVGREFRRRVKNAFDADGIEIPFPHVSLHFGEGSRPIELVVRREGGQRGSRQGRSDA